MQSDFEFKVGETYANRRDTYTVLAIEGPNLKVRFEDGREGLLELATQARIIRNMLLPPAVPEPPPRTRSTTAAKAAPAAPARTRAATTTPRATSTRSRKSTGSELSAASFTAMPGTPPAPTTRTRAARVVHSDLTLPQLSALPREERRDKLTPLLTSRAAFLELIERSVEAERGRFRLFTPDHVRDLQRTEMAPTRNEPEQLLDYALNNRGYLDGREQEILARHYPLLEGGVEIYVLDLLAYDTNKQAPIVVETRVKSTQRQWLWEALLEGLRNWVGFSRAANLTEAFAAHPVQSQPLLAVVAPSAFWHDNEHASLPKIADFQQQSALNTNLLLALRDWLGIKPLLLQVPDTWIRDADDPGRLSVMPATGF